MNDPILTLQQGEITLQGQFMNSSNYTFLVTVTHGGQRLQAVYKPAKGERPLWDFPEGTLARRETAAFLLSDALGWHLVPPTVYRLDGPAGGGALQLFIEHDPDYHFFTMTPADRAALTIAAVFDILINNADRKGGHILRDAGGKLWLIDHGVSFHTEDKLRTVIWDFIGQPVPEAWITDIAQVSDMLTHASDLREQMAALLSAEEIEALAGRMDALVRNPVFRGPNEDGMPYPWPPI